MVEKHAIYRPASQRKNSLSELAERLGGRLAFRHTEHVEPHSLRQRPALTWAGMRDPPKRSQAALN